MHSKLVDSANGLRRFILVLDPGDEACQSITRFAKQEHVDGASLTAIGAFEHATVGWFDLDTKEYRPVHIDEQCEALSLIGDIASGDDAEPSVHMHAVVGLRDGTTRGGHLMAGKVRPTLEVTVAESALQLRRRRRPELGVALIDLGAAR
jgi:hypothetical protein